LIFGEIRTHKTHKKRIFADFSAVIKFPLRYPRAFF